MGKKKKTVDTAEEIMTEELSEWERLHAIANGACERARETCSRIIRELDAEIEAMTHKEDTSCTR